MKKNSLLAKATTKQFGKPITKSNFKKLDILAKISLKLTKKAQEQR